MKSLPMSAVLTFAIVAILLVPVSASAFGLSGIGGRVGSVDPEGSGGAFTVGGHFEFEEAGSRLHLQPGVMYWSKDNVSDFNPNFDVLYHFNSAGSVGPYVGAGAGVHFYSFDTPFADNSDTDLGANMFAGLLIPSSSVRLFVEGRYVASDRSQAMITGGVTLPFGH